MNYKFFFSPQPDAQKNEFIKDFYTTLSKKVNVINYGKKPISMSFDFLRYSFRTNVMILNWPEDILHLRFGVIQLFISFIALTFFKIKGGRIVWICHNKESHKKRYKWLRKIIRSFYTRISNIIIVLSKDALNHFYDVKNKVFFLDHPTYLHFEIIKNEDTNPQTDVLIWGHISPYKGLNEFIKNYRKHESLFKVKIIGKADKKYFEILKQQAKDLNIDLIDKYLTNEELVYNFKNSKIILLPYGNEDTFSSGALIHSLCSGKIIIGPAVGNFIDLNEYGACLVYKDFNNLFNIIKSLLENQFDYEQELIRLRKGIKNYYDLNSWEQFVDRLLNIVYKNSGLGIINKTKFDIVNQLN